MQEVAVGNYRAFISAADALLSIREEVSAVDMHLETLVLVHQLNAFLFYFHYYEFLMSFLFRCICNCDLPLIGDVLPVE